MSVSDRSKTPAKADHEEDVELGDKKVDEGVQLKLIEQRNESASKIDSQVQ